MAVKTLYVTIGVPGSGKSTWIKNNVPDATVISPDAYLEEKFGYDWTPVNSAKAWAASYQALGRAVVTEVFQNADAEYVWDSTNTTSRDRSAVINFGKGAGWKVIAVYFDTPFEVCQERNNERPRHRRVPDKAMADMQFRLTPPAEGEFDDCIYERWVPK